MKTLVDLFNERKSDFVSLSQWNFSELHEAQLKAKKFWESFLCAYLPDDEGCCGTIVKELLYQNNYIVSRIKEIPRTVSFLSFIGHLFGKRVSFVTYKIEIHEEDVKLLGQLFNDADVIVERMANEKRGEEIVTNPSPIGPDNETVSLARFESLVESYQTILFDVYDSLNNPTSKTIKRDVTRKLHGQGYDVVDYTGDNDDIFDIRLEENLSSIEVVSPTIQRISDGKIIIKGIVNKPLS